MGVEKSPIASDDISLAEVVQQLKAWVVLLQSKWKLIVLFGLFGCLVGYFFAKLKHPVYKAELTFALEDEKADGLGGALSIASQFGLDLGGGGGGAFTGDNLLHLIRSRSMIQKSLLESVVIDGRMQTLAERYIEFNNLRDKWEGKPELQSLKFPSGIDPEGLNFQQSKTLGEFYKTILGTILSVERVDKKLSIISVKVVSRDEQFSKYFTEVLVDEVSDFYIQMKTKRSANNLAILQNKTDSVRRILNSAISGVASSVDANPNPNPAMQMLRVPSQKRQIDAQANQLLLTELVKNLELSKISLRRETPLIQIIDTPIFPLEKIVLSKALMTIFGGGIFAFFTCLFLIVRNYLRRELS